MTIAFGVLIGLAIAFTAYWLWSLVADYNTKKLESYEEWSDRFFSISGRLFDRDDLPEEWVDTISHLNSWIDDRSMPWALSRLYARKNARRLSGEKTEANLPKDVAAFLEKHPSIGRDYIAAMRSAFMAMTFLSPLNMGKDIRAYLAEDWERQNFAAAEIWTDTAPSEYVAPEKDPNVQ